MFFNNQSRSHGTNRNGGSFSEVEIQQVWEKGQTIFGKDSRYWRKDTCGATIYRFDYGKTESSFGWEIDHIKPVAKGGSDYEWNLQPLQWQNNRSKGDNYPYFTCKIRA